MRLLIVWNAGQFGFIIVLKKIECVRFHMSFSKHCSVLSAYTAKTRLFAYLSAQCDKIEESVPISPSRAFRMNALRCTLEFLHITIYHAYKHHVMTVTVPPRVRLALDKAKYKRYVSTSWHGTRHTWLVCVASNTRPGLALTGMKFRLFQFILDVHRSFESFIVEQFRCQRHAQTVTQRMWPIVTCQIWFLVY